MVFVLILVIFFNFRSYRLTFIGFDNFFFFLDGNTIIKHKVVKINIYFLSLGSFLAFLFCLLLFLDSLGIGDDSRSINRDILLFFLNFIHNFSRVSCLFFGDHLSFQLQLHLRCKNGLVPLYNGAFVINVLLGIRHDSTFCEIFQCSLVATLLHEHQLFTVPVVQIGGSHKGIHRTILSVLACTIDT